MSTDYPELFVSPEWLKEHLGDNDVRVVDGSWHLPGSGRNAREEYDREHIPLSVYFDIDNIADTDSTLPHMLPTPDAFAEAMGAMGLSDDHRIVVYDTQGLFSAARVWWTLSVMGAENVRILRGGLPAWKAAGGPVTDEIAPPEPARFDPVFNPRRVVDLKDMRHEVANPDSLIIDARPAGRFSGRNSEPRPGVRSGHIPTSVNLPAADLIENGKLIARDKLDLMFAAAGVTHDRPVVTSCGSGVTAAILSLGLTAIGHENHALYDGSWAEWGGREDTEIETDD